MLDFVLLIPCYDNIDGLSISINSIQYPSNTFEILIIDDGSVVPIALDNFNIVSAKMPIKIIRLEKNQGIVHALNTGLKLLQHRKDFKYIARLDCGDICAKDRFVKQVNYLNANSDIHLLGSWCKFIDHKKQSSYLYKTKTTHNDILKEMNFKCSFMHPTVMFRASVILSVGVYPTNYSLTEDYAYFWKILNKHKVAILPEILTTIEINPNSLSAKNYKKQLLQRIKVINQFSNHFLFKRIGILMLAFRYILPTKFVLLIKYLR